jgi:hypothetical protein
MRIFLLLLAITPTTDQLLVPQATHVAGIYTALMRYPKSSGVMIRKSLDSCRHGRGVTTQRVLADRSLENAQAFAAVPRPPPG